MPPGQAREAISATSKEVAPMHELLREWVDLKRSTSVRGNRKRRALDVVQIPRLRTFGFALLILMTALAPAAIPRWLPELTLGYLALPYLVVRAFYDRTRFDLAT